MKQRTREHNLKMMQQSGPSIKLDRITEILKKQLSSKMCAKVLAAIHKEASVWLYSKPHIEFDV